MTLDTLNQGIGRHVLLGSAFLHVISGIINHNMRAYLIIARGGLFPALSNLAALTIQRSGLAVWVL